MYQLRVRPPDLLVHSLFIVSLHTPGVNDYASSDALRLHPSDPLVSLSCYSLQVFNAYASSDALRLHFFYSLVSLYIFSLTPGINEYASSDALQLHPSTVIPLFSLSV
jgi:hypothetical protein